MVSKETESVCIDLLSSAIKIPVPVSSSIISELREEIDGKTKDGVFAVLLGDATIKYISLCQSLAKLYSAAGVDINKAITGGEELNKKFSKFTERLNDDNLQQ